MFVKSTTQLFFLINIKNKRIVLHSVNGVSNEKHEMIIFGIFI